MMMEKVGFALLFRRPITPEALLLKGFRLPFTPDVYPISLSL